METANEENEILNCSTENETTLEINKSHGK